MADTRPTSRIGPKTLAAIAEGEALISPLDERARRFGQKRETYKEFAQRVALIAVEEIAAASEKPATVRPNLDLFIVVMTSDGREAVCAAYAADEADAGKIVQGRYTGWTVARVIPKLTRAVFRLFDSDWESEYAANR